MSRALSLGAHRFHDGQLFMPMGLDTLMLNLFFITVPLNILLNNRMLEPTPAYAATAVSAAVSIYVVAVHWSGDKSAGARGRSPAAQN